MSLAAGGNMAKVNEALDTSEKLVQLLRGLAGVVRPEYLEAVPDLQEVCKKLLDANESLVRWISSFRDFDIKAPEATERFKKLAANYKALKTGKRYKELKFDCGEIQMIYQLRLHGKLRDIFSGEKLQKAERVFEKLSTADAELVRFVHMDIFGQLDSIRARMEAALNNHDSAAAETARLEFKVSSDPLIRRLQNIGDRLADLILEYQNIAQNKMPDQKINPTGNMPKGLE